MSRSELYSTAVAEYVKAQKGLGVRERLDAVYAIRPEESTLEREVAKLQDRSVGRDQ